MGNFITNFQLRIGDVPVSVLIPNLVTRLRDVAQAEGYVEATNGEEAERDIVVFTNLNDRWITVCDSHISEHQNGNEIQRFTQQLSVVNGGTAIGIAISDSDVLQLHLCRDGKLIDAFSNMPDYGEMSDELRASLKGNASAWKDFLIKDATIEDLALTWRERPIFVEEMLVLVARLVGLDTTTCLLDARDVEQSNSLEYRTLAHLRFRSKVKSKIPFIHDQPSKLESSGGTTELTCLLDKPLWQSAAWQGQDLGVPDHTDVFLCDFISRGGSSSGLAVVFMGEAVEKRIITLTHVGISQGKLYEKYPMEPVTHEGQQFLRTVIKDFLIPPGIPSESEQNVTRRLAWNAHLQIMHQLSFSIRAIGTGSREGVGDLIVICFPLANPQQGQAGWKVTVSVS